MELKLKSGDVVQAPVPESVQEAVSKFGESYIAKIVKKAFVTKFKGIANKNGSSAQASIDAFDPSAKKTRRKKTAVEKAAFKLSKLSPEEQAQVRSLLAIKE